MTDTTPTILDAQGFPAHPPEGSYRHDRDNLWPDAERLRMALSSLSPLARRAVAEWQDDQPYNPVCYHAYGPGFAARRRIYGRWQYRLTPLGLAVQREIQEGRA